MKIDIRTATLEDLPVLFDFEQGVIETERPMDPDLRLDEIHYYDVKELIQSPEVELVVATINDQVVSCGYAQVCDSKSWHKHDRHCYLGFMYTLPNFRGKGINKMVVDALKTWSLAQGINDLILEVYHNNPGAIKAYEKAGFGARLLEMRMNLG